MGRVSQSKYIKKVAENIKSVLGSKLGLFAFYKCVILSMIDNIAMIDMIDKTGSRGVFISAVTLTSQTCLKRLKI